MGAQVISTSSSDAKLERTKALGADHVINYKTTKDWGRQVLDLTSGRGVDHVVEVGGPRHTSPVNHSMPHSWPYFSYWVLTGREGAIPTAALMIKQQDLRGIIVGSRKHQVDMVRAIETTGLKPMVDKVFPLEDIANAFRHEESVSHFGKICLQL